MGPEDHIQVDLADPDGTHAAIAEIKQRLENGELHALVNNAAISPKADGGKRLSSIDTTIDVWDHVFRVNFLAPITLARGLLQELKAAKGSVVNVTSIAGSRVHPSARPMPPPRRRWRRSPARWRPISARSASASTPSPPARSILQSSPGTEEIVAHDIPMHRLGTPDEVAKIIYVLCTETSSYVNGRRFTSTADSTCSRRLKPFLPFEDEIRQRRCNQHQHDGER